MKNKRKITTVKAVIKQKKEIKTKQEEGGYCLLLADEP